VPEQALTAHEALAGYTLAPALAAGEEGVAGRIHGGMRADLTGLLEDPVHAPDAPVWLTVVAGRVVHRLMPEAEAVPSFAGRSRPAALARG
jgi:predicted amidohydrolase YtcJ